MQVRGLRNFAAKVLLVESGRFGTSRLPQVRSWREGQSGQGGAWLGGVGKQLGGAGDLEETYRGLANGQQEILRIGD